jgi:ectoine hydroxylase-related dioxygenase (phytanoyl-CoA dioxygenase family)
MTDWLAALDSDGFAVVPEILPSTLVGSLIAAAEPLLAALPPGPRGGVRELLAVMPAARKLAASPVLRRWVEPVLGADCVAVGGTLFDKADGRNWKVPYHQDITIRTKQRVELPGFGPWWEKNGVPHTWPPAAVVERMLAVRVHLDECGPENGPLRVLPGTHRDGILSGDEIDTRRDRGPEVACHLPRGGMLAVRPLLLHASSVAVNPSRRRVLHIEFAAAGALPDGLDWHDV